MIRPFIFTAAAWLASSAIVVQAQATSPPNNGDFAQGPAQTSDIQFASSSQVGDRAHPDAQQAGFELQEQLPPGTSSSVDGTLSPVGEYFRPVCDCYCGIPSLDQWCVYDVYCGQTTGPNCSPCDGSQGNCYLLEDGTWVCNDTCCDVWGEPVCGPSAAVRFGWWGISTDGSQNKTGEYQDFEPSPFWDVDLITSDGVRTWDIVLSGIDDETNDARVRFYGPQSSGRFDFQRYLHRLDHDPLAGLALAPGEVPPDGPEGNVIVQDLNVGEDYAIRVEELDARFQGRVTDHVKWRLNLWGQRKFGERQVNATAHCFNVVADDPPGATGNVCHVLSQRQSIDWMTMEVQPVVEASFDNVSVEYSRTMRSFGSDDEAVYRQYTRFGYQGAGGNGSLGDDYIYALVPESFTQIDRLKISAQMTEYNQLYANLYVGDTKNKFRDTHRDYDGYDLRWINTSIDDVTLTAYTSRYDETNEYPPFYLSEPPYAPSETEEENSLRHPIDYTRTRAGIKGTWQPFGDRGPRWSNYGLWDGTTIASGYEYYQLERDYVTWEVDPTPFTQPNTRSHQIEIGPSTRWSPMFNTYTRYKVRFVDVPLIGVTERAEDDPPGVEGTFNSNLPEQEHIVEVGGTWTPAPNFMTTAQFSVVNSWHHSEYADFDQDSYPFTVSMWYAPTSRLSLSGGYAYFTNSIDQEITLGANRGNLDQIETTPWAYAGDNQLISFGVNYALTPCVQLIGGYEYDRGSNTFNIPTSPHAADGVDWSTVESVGAVVVETNRVTTGLDWQPYNRTNLYVRYIYYQYDDISSGLYTGTAHMALAGVTRTW